MQKDLFPMNEMDLKFNKIIIFFMSMENENFRIPKVLLHELKLQRLSVDYKSPC